MNVTEVRQILKDAFAVRGLKLTLGCSEHAEIYLSLTDTEGNCIFEDNEFELTPVLLPTTSKQLALVWYNEESLLSEALGLSTITLQLKLGRVEVYVNGEPQERWVFTPPELHQIHWEALSFEMLASTIVKELPPILIEQGLLRKSIHTVCIMFTAYDL